MRTRRGWQASWGCDRSPAHGHRRPPGGRDTEEEDTPSHWRRLAPPAVVAVLLLAWSNLVLPALPADAVLKALFNLGGVAAMVDRRPSRSA